MAPTVHLIYGPSGAGKSTHAHQLATDHHAVRFAIDDWMHGLYGDDRPARLDMAWVLPRLRRCEALIWQTSRQILDTGRDVVLDLGLMRRADRAPEKPGGSGGPCGAALLCQRRPGAALAAGAAPQCRARRRLLVRGDAGHV